MKIAQLAATVVAALALVALVTLRLYDLRVPQTLPVQYNCTGNAIGASCAATNPLTETSAGLCFEVSITRSGAQAAAKSMPICTGTIGPRETRNIEGKWAEGSPTELCTRTKNVLGQEIEQLDWSVCELKIREL